MIFEQSTFFLTILTARLFLFTGSPFVLYLYRVFGVDKYNKNKNKKSENSDIFRKIKFSFVGYMRPFRKKQFVNYSDTH